jgi:hypothetical protein
MAGLTSYENIVVRILADKKTACAVDIAAVLYPGEAELRPKISQVSVVLRRLEKKGVVRESAKDGKKAFFTMAAVRTVETVAIAPERKEETPTPNTITDAPHIELYPEQATETGDTVIIDTETAEKPGWPIVRILDLPEDEENVQQ